jgi:hypothetical protein
MSLGIGLLQGPTGGGGSYERGTPVQAAEALLDELGAIEDDAASLGCAFHPRYIRVTSA